MNGVSPKRVWYKNCRHFVTSRFILWVKLFTSTDQGHTGTIIISPWLGDDILSTSSRFLYMSMRIQWHSTAIIVIIRVTIYDPNPGLNLDWWHARQACYLLNPQGCVKLYEELAQVKKHVGLKATIESNPIWTNHNIK